MKLFVVVHGAHAVVGQRYTRPTRSRRQCLTS
jgi:hypothetical protein